MNAQIKSIGDARYFSYTLLLLLSSLCSFTLFSQTGDQKLTETILYKDSLFWNAYNNCNVNTFTDFFTEDIEFYHDKWGITLGAAALDASGPNASRSIVSRSCGLMSPTAITAIRSGRYQVS